MQRNRQYIDSQILANKLKVVLQSQITQKRRLTFISNYKDLLQIYLHFILQMRFLFLFLPVFFLLLSTGGLRSEQLLALVFFQLIHSLHQIRLGSALS